MPAPERLSPDAKDERVIRACLRFLGWCALVLAPLALAQAEEAPTRPTQRTAASQANVQQLAGRIDEMIATGWAGAGVRPAPRAEDAAFLRRVYLDVAGKIPPVAEVRRFLADSTPDKRQRLIERLLDSPGYISHFSTVWRLLLVPEEQANLRQLAALPLLEEWLRQQLANEIAYDQMVRTLLTFPLDDPRPDPKQPSPRAFFLGKENKPDELAAATTRLFLGVRLECAQCHDHPFARWKRDQFWSQAAFFTGLNEPMRPDGVRAAFPVPQLPIPGGQRVARARFLDDTEPEWSTAPSPRQTLADWLVTPENPFFARAAVNRLWGHFFGIGLVDPVDDLTEANPPSHPELLDELARAFVAHQYDLKFLIRAILLSNTYQFSGSAGPAEPSKPRLFNRMAVKSLTPEQLFDSLAQATGYREPVQAGSRRPTGNARRTFLARFPRTEQRTDVATSITQALALMNGKLVAEVTSLERSTALSAVAHAPFMETAERIKTLFLATLSRPPRPEEAERLARYVAAGGSSADPQEALADVFWALLNSGEFLFNH